MIYAYQKQTQPRKKVLNQIFRFLKRKKAVLALVLAITAATSSYYVFGLRTQKAEAAWWDDTWRYRKAVNITNSSGSTLTEFQVSFTLDTASLISAGKMQADCDDIRITDSGGNLIPHWIEENNPGCNNSATKIWTKVPSIPTSGTTIYVYYGNSSAGNVESGDNVFEFFDDFNESTLNTNKWVVMSGQNTPQVSNGTLSLGSNETWITAKNKDWSQYIFQSRFKVLNLSYPGFLYNHYQEGYAYDAYWESGWNYTKVYRHYGTNKYSDRTAVGNYSFGGSIIQNSWYTGKFSINGNNVNFTIVGVGSWNLTTENNYSHGSVGFLHYDVGSGGMDIDFTFVRKYASTEPSASPSSTEEQSPAPVAYWKFDEGYGTTANDSTGTNNGTISGASWQTEDLCMTGKCLKFDGTDDYVGIGSTANEIKTVSFWVKPNTTSTYLLALNGSAYISASSGTISATGFTNPTIYVNGKQSTTLVANQWQHIVVTTNTGITASAITLGKVSSNYLQGFLDEVKLYNFARTANQIKADYNAGKAKAGSAKGAAVVMGSPEGGVNLSEGLVGYWKMDEASWTNDCSTYTVIDSSGNGNNGKSCPASTGPTGGAAGKFGNGGSFDGSDDYVTVPTNPDNGYSVSTWVYLNSTSNMDIYGDEVNYKGMGFQVYSGHFYTIVSTGSSPHRYSIGVSPSANRWYHVVQVFETNSVKTYINGELKNTSNYTLAKQTDLTFKIGRSSNGSYFSGYFNGKIDEVRIYNRALSPAEVRALYEWAPGPVAHFKLDDGNGTSPVDSSGFGRIGSIVNGIWSVGKFGKGIKLDGSGDYIQINDF